MPKTAFIEEYDHDIFVSYAHVDNEKVFDQEGWVNTLVNKLGHLINKDLGRIGSLSIWWDKTNLRGNDVITPKIQHKIENSAPSCSSSRQATWRQVGVCRSWHFSLKNIKAA